MKRNRIVSYVNNAARNFKMQCATHAIPYVYFIEAQSCQVFFSIVPFVLTYQPATGKYIEYLLVKFDGTVGRCSFIVVY